MKATAPAAYLAFVRLIAQMAPALPELWPFQGRAVVEQAAQDDAAENEE